MKFRLRRLVAIIAACVILTGVVYQSLAVESHEEQGSPVVEPTTQSAALVALDALAIKGRAPKTGYERTAFGNGWKTVNGCDTRNVILNRDLIDVQTNDNCQVIKGTLVDPYTATAIEFSRGENSADIQIDHVVALSDAWQKGAQSLTYEMREKLANDPLELLAVDGAANQEKGDSDAASWLPKNKLFRCEYVARQIAVKQKYSLWVTRAEYDAMKSVLSGCPGQLLP